MISTFIKGTVTSCKKEERDKIVGGFPKVTYRTIIDVVQFGNHKLTEKATWFMDLPTETPIGASIEFIYEIGEPE